jgi:hypothetical protein
MLFKNVLSMVVPLKYASANDRQHAFELECQCIIKEIEVATCKINIERLPVKGAIITNNTNRMCKKRIKFATENISMVVDILLIIN